jgi:hypothetical protein
MAFTASSWGQGLLLTGLSPGSSLSGFTAVITKANLPTSALDTGSLSCLNGGGDWRFSTDIDGVNQLPVEIIDCVTNATASSTKFEAQIRFPTYSSGTRSVYAFWNKTGQSQPLDSASFGSEEVWQDFIAALHLYDGSLADSTGNGYNGTLGGTSPTALSERGYSFSNGFITLGAVPLDGRSTVSVYCTFKNSAASADRGIWYLNNDGGGSDEPFGIRQDSTISRGTAVVTFQSSFSQEVGGISYRLEHLTNSSTTAVQRSCNVFDNQSAAIYMDGANDLESVLDTNSSTTLDTGTGDLRLGTGPKARYSGEIHSFYVKETADSSDFVSSIDSNKSDPSAFWTAGTVFVPSGGTTLVMTIGESISGADTESTKANFMSTLSETLATADQSTAKLTAIYTLPESTTILDIQEGKLSALLSVSEITNADDIEQGRLSGIFSVSESAGANDNDQGKYATSQEMIEAVQANDLTTALFNALLTQSLGAIASDSVSFKTTFGLTLNESASSTDEQGSIASLGLTVSETAAGDDTDSGKASLISTLSESLSGSDNLSFTTPGIILTVGETVASADNLSISANFKMTIGESANLTDSASSKASLISSIAESISSSDSFNRISVFSLTIGEAVSAIDLLSAIDANLLGLITATITIDPLITASSVINPLISGTIEAIPTITGTIKVT